MLKIKGQRPDPLIWPISPYEMFALTCRGKHGDDIAVIEHDWRFTRRDAMRDIHNTARALVKLGVKRGDIVTIATGRSLYISIVVTYAVNLIGATICLLDENHAYNTLVNYLREFETPVCFTYGWDTTSIEQLQRDVRSIRHIVNIDPMHEKDAFMDSVLELCYVDGTTLAKMAARFQGKLQVAGGNPDRLALISFTSGSTSGPKPMMFTNRNIIALIMISMSVAEMDFWDKKLHTWTGVVHLDCPYGLVISIIMPLCSGGAVITTPYFSRDTFSYYLSQGPNVLLGVPQIVEAFPVWLKPDTDISSLRFIASGGERLEKEISLATRKFLEENGAPDVTIASGYGTGEALGMISTAFGVAYDPDSVGVIPPGVHVMLLDKDTGEELGCGEEGIICVAGEHILTGYYHRPELDKEKIFVTKDGTRFVNTGDLGVIDEDGRVRMVGRADFFLTSKRTKVYYKVVQKALQNSDKVKECHVVKGPDPQLRFGPYAFVVLNEGESPTERTKQAIIEAAKQPFQIGEQEIALKDYEMPRPEHIVFIERLPQRRGKIDLWTLEKMAKTLGEVAKEVNAGTAG